MNYWTNWIPGLADPACKISQQGDGSNFMNMYRNSGMNLFIANNSVEEGTIKVLQGLRNGKIKICRTLNNLLSEIRMYARNEDGQIIKGNDHLLDAMRYLIMSGVNIAITRQEYEYSNIYFNKNKGNYQVASYV
jgi:hypothetical protein